MVKKTILVLYYTRGVYPLRNTIETHLYSWRKHSKHHVLYVNVALGFPEDLVRRLHIDVIIFHTIFLGMRWSPEIFAEYTEKCSILKTILCTKLAIPQDEFINTELLNEFINHFGVTHVLTCANESDVRMIYDRVNRKKVTFRQVLTGYLDHETVEWIRVRRNNYEPREIDVGYRAWKAEYWLGEHGQHKAKLPELVAAAARVMNLSTDISTRNEDVFTGNDWFDFLLRCRATVGVEGGASVLDKDGRIRERVEAYLSDHPDATFEEVRSHCFPSDDNKLRLACISPRHLEACATGTLQLLVEGGYNGILTPWNHYVPIKKDYSNITEALQILNDKAAMRAITETALHDIVESEKWTYKSFVQDIEDTIIDARGEPVVNSQISQAIVRVAFALREFLNWQFIRFETWCRATPNRRRAARLAYRFFCRLFPAA